MLFKGKKGLLEFDKFRVATHQSLLQNHGLSRSSVCIRRLQCYERVLHKRWFRGKNDRQELKQEAPTSYEKGMGRRTRRSKFSRDRRDNISTCKRHERRCRGEN